MSHDTDQPATLHIFLSEDTRLGHETGAGAMRNRCAFTSRDMGADWPEAFTFAVVYGWGGDPDDPEDTGAWAIQAAKWGWDDTLVEFLQRAHAQFAALPDKTNDDASTQSETATAGGVATSEEDVSALDDLIAEWWRTCETPTVWHDGEHLASTLLARTILESPEFAAIVRRHAAAPAATATATEPA